MQQSSRSEEDSNYALKHFTIRHTRVSRTLMLVTKQHHLSNIDRCIRAISAADTQGAHHMTRTTRSQAVYPAAVSSRGPLNA